MKKQDKALSGKYFLAVVSGLCLIWVTGLIAHLADGIEDDQMRVQIIGSLIMIVASAISAVITFYFTKQTDDPNERDLKNQLPGSRD